MDVDAMFSFDVKKYKVVGVIMTYILREIQFHTSGIDYPHSIWNKMKTLFNAINECELIQIEKELIPLEPLSFDWIEDYFDCIMELQLKPGECGMDFLKKDENSFR